MTTVRGESGGTKVSHPSSLGGDSDARDIDYYLIGLPSWKKDLLLRRKQADMVRSESYPSEFAAAAAASLSRQSSAEQPDEARRGASVRRGSSSSETVMPTVHGSLSRRMSGGGGAAAAPPSPAAAAEPAADDVPYEPGFVSRLRMRYAKLATAPEDAAVAAPGSGRRQQPVETTTFVATTTRVVGDPRSPPASYLLRRRSSGARDIGEIVILELGGQAAAPPPPALGRTAADERDGTARPRAAQPLLDERTRVPAAAAPAVSAVGKDEERASPGAGTAAAVTRPPPLRASVPQQTERPERAAAIGHSGVAVSASSATVQTIEARAGQARGAAAPTSSVTPAASRNESSHPANKDTPASRATTAAAQSISATAGSQRSPWQSQLPVRTTTAAAPTTSAGTSSVTASLSTAASAAASESGTTTATASAEPEGGSGEYFRRALREVVPERGTGKRLLDTRTEIGFQRRVPDYERRDGKVPVFLNASVVVGRGSFRKSSAPQQAKMRQNVSFSDLTDTKVYPSEEALMVEMKRESGSAYYDDPTAWRAASMIGPADDDDTADGELQAMTSTALSSRVAAAARSETLGSYRASLAGTYSFGQHLLSEQQHPNGFGQWPQPGSAAESENGTYYPGDIVVKPADGIGADEAEQERPAAFSESEASDLLF